LLPKSLNDFHHTDPKTIYAPLPNNQWYWEYIYKRPVVHNLPPPPQQTIYVWLHTVVSRITDRSFTGTYWRVGVSVLGIITQQRLAVSVAGPHYFGATPAPKMIYTIVFACNGTALRLRVFTDMIIYRKSNWNVVII
jgi:hypothetical protein